MSAQEARVQDALESIRARVGNWTQGKGYQPGGRPQDAAVHDVIFLINHVADLEEEAREARAWERRYNELLELCESTRPKPERNTNE